MPLRVLGLHGFSQCAEVFDKKRTKELQKRLKSLVSLRCFDGPLELPQLGPEARCWWNYSADIWDGKDIAALSRWTTSPERSGPEKVDCIGVQDAVRDLRKEWDAGGYDGVLGFSQGAIAAAVLCASLRDAGKPLPKFAVLISGPLIRLGGLSFFPPDPPLDVPSLHIWGKEDMIPGERVKALATLFAPASSAFHEHDGAHFVPSKNADLDVVASFLKGFESSEGGPSPKPGASQPASSTASAEASKPAGKKPRPAPPAPPAAVATASLLVRGAAAKVFGLRPGPAGGELQPVWVTAPGNAKVTINLDGATRLPFPKDEAHGALIDAIEAATEELVTQNAPISVFELDKSTAEARYGDAMYDANSAKGDIVRLAYIPGAALVAIPSNWSLCPTTGACGKVTFQQKTVEPESKKKPDTMILAKKKELSVRFSVANGDSGETFAPPSRDEPSADAVKELDSAIVRVSVPGVDTPAADGAEAAGKEVAPTAEGEAEEAMEVNPWEVTGRIDYAKLITQFGSTEISQKLLQRIEKLTVGKGNVKCLHPWLRRGIFFSHRDLDLICKMVEEGKPFYLYTGRGPSSAAMHLGHLIPFMMTKWLQDAFGVPLVIQMTDDEKFLWKGTWEPEKGDNLMYFRHLTTENAKDIIACGFDRKKTFIFSDLDYFGHMYPNVVRIWKAITYSTARSAFGFQGDSNIGQSAFPAVQAAPSFPSTFKVPLRGMDNMCCLIPCAIDQDPYFRITRDVAHKIVPTSHPLKGKPALIHSKFFPPLQGASGKMSASQDSSAVFLTDTAEQIESKIMKHAFSGGRQTAKEQREKGADLEVDVAYKWLSFFLDDDARLEEIGKSYGSGQGDYWNTGSVKKCLVEQLQEIVARHQEQRAKITDEEVADWMKVRELEF